MHKRKISNITEPQVKLTLNKILSEGCRLSGRRGKIGARG